MVERKSFYTFGSYALGAASELLAPVLGAYARSVCRRPPSPPAEWRCGLILGATRIGDVLYRTPSLKMLAEGLPQCQWHYLTEPVSAEVLRGNPALAGVLPWSAAEPMFHLSDERLEELRRMNFDVALCTDASRYHTNLRIALKLGIPNRAGFTFRGLSSWVTHPVPIRYPSSAPEYFRQMVGHLTGQAPDWPLQPQVFPSQSDAQAAEDLWRELKLDSSAVVPRETTAVGPREMTPPVVACFLSTRQPSLVWPQELLAEALERVSAKRPVTFVLCGAKSDEGAIQAMADRLRAPHRINCGRLSLLPLVLFLKKCRAVYSPDSGPRHLANAAGTPVVFIRNLRVSKVETGAYCDTDIDVSPNVEIVPESDQARYFLQVLPATVAEKIIEAIDRPR